MGKRREKSPAHRFEPTTSLSWGVRSTAVLPLCYQRCPSFAILTLAAEINNQLLSLGCFALANLLSKEKFFCIFSPNEQATCLISGAWPEPSSARSRSGPGQFSTRTRWKIRYKGPSLETEPESTFNSFLHLFSCSRSQMTFLRWGLNL